MVDPLTRLAILHGTDKFGMHDYTPVYHALLADRRDRPLKMLEIGVGGYDDPLAGGESLAMWRDYLPEASIVGLDVAAKQLDLGPRVTIVQGSQIDPDVIARLIAEHGPFDVILDDGSHHNAHVWQSFTMLFPALKPGGLYLVEDVQAAFMLALGGSITMTAPNTIGSFGGLMLDLGRPDAAMPQGPVISRIDRMHNIIAVTTAEEGAAPEALPLTPGGAALAVGRAGLWGIELTEPRVEQGDHALWEDHLALRDRLDQMADGEALAIPGWPAATAPILNLFQQIDHVEQSLAFPHVQPIETAPLVIQMTGFRDGVLLVKGPNDYPSNFQFHFGAERARTAFQWYNDLLLDPEQQPVPPLSQFAQLLSVLHQAHRHASAPPLLRRLVQQDRADRDIAALAQISAARAGCWPEAAAVTQLALRDSDDALLGALMSWSLTKIEAHRGDAREVLGLDRETDDDTLNATILALCDAVEPPEGVMATAIAYLRHDLGAGPYPLQIG
ncbi:hypothetical protein [Paracoccus sp. NSM]|uniref:hypothetical protein n=1 Tax=Paracoccus sp. NSM TaxID=3457784 RepID=UPI0040373E54